MPAYSCLLITISPPPSPTVRAPAPWLNVEHKSSLACIPSPSLCNTCECTHWLKVDILVGDRINYPVQGTQLHPAPKHCTKLSTVCHSDREKRKKKGHLVISAAPLLSHLGQPAYQVVMGCFTPVLHTNHRERWGILRTKLLPGSV